MTTPEQPLPDAAERVANALDRAANLAGDDSAHHKAFAIDQIVRALTGCPMVQQSALDYRGEPYTYWTQGQSPEYDAWIAAYRDGEDGPETYSWDEGIAP